MANSVHKLKKAEVSGKFAGQAASHEEREARKLCRVSFGAGQVRLT